MNLKNLFRTLLVLLFFVGVANAQFYVNNVTGNDANPGTAALPKATVSSALLAAPANSTISVAATGVNYTESTPGMNLLPGPLTAGVTGTYTFISTGGTPVFTNQFQVGTAATAGTITFSGPFQFNGLYLKNGTLVNGNQITITTGATVTRTEVGSISAGQLAFAGTANFNYIDEVAAASNITVGLEFPTATNVANNLTLTATAANLTLTLDQNRTINGLLNGDGDAGANTGTLALSTFTLNFNNAGALAHTIDGNVTGTGSLSFNLGANASLDGLNAARTITNLVVGGGTFTFTLDPAGASTISTVGNVTLNGTASLTMQNTGTIGTITHNGAGLLTTAQTSPGTVGNVLMSSTATSAAIVRLSTAGAGGTVNTGTVTQSGQGVITFGANVTAAVNTGNVLLNTTFALSTAAAQTGRGLITFDNFGGGGLAAVTVTGTLTNEAIFGGSIDDAGNTNNGIILFANTGAVTVTAATTVNVTGTVTITAPGTFVDNGNIAFSAATGAGNFGAITNTSTINVGTGVTGTIYTSAGAATFAGGLTTGAISSSSLNNGTAGFGDIEFNDVTGAFTIASISQSAVALGGDILLGNANLSVTGDITNARTAAGANIQWGTAGGAGTLTVQNVKNTGASNILFTRTVGGAVTINANLEQTGTGTISFPNATTATLALVGWTVSNGTLNIAGTSATGGVTVTGPVVLSGGTVDLGNGARTVTMNNSSIQIGGAASVTFLNTGGATCNTEFLFTQPIPNVQQNITIGGLNQEFPGYITVNNVSAIPAPYVIFQSLNGSTGSPGNLYITNTGGAANGLTFNSTFGGVINTTRLDNVRLYIGKNNPGGAAGGGFQNTTGYSTTNGGFIMMNGNAAQVVNAANPTSATVTFGNFGVDNNSGVVPAVTFGANPNLATFAGASEFYLAEGGVNFTNARFSGTAPWPTVYRTEGTFTTVPAVVAATMINVTYYGNDKTTANEVAVGATAVNNVTVATTNGASAGKGIVTLLAPLTVNGTLTINTDQSLYTAANVLTLNGASAVVNGYLVDDGTTRVQLAATTGTTFTGTGWLPGIQVNAASVGNVIAGRGLVSNGFGGDGVWGGGNDDFTTMDASINYAGGAASSLTATFLVPTAPSTTNFLNLTTAAGATFTLGANAIMGGNMNHAAGSMVLGDFTLDHQGVTPQMTGGALITSNTAGKLFFQTGSPSFVVNTAAATIGANVEYSADGGTFTLQDALNPSFNLTINGNLTLTDKSAAAGGATFDIGNGITLTAGGNVKVNANCGFTAVDAGTTGILRINPVTAPSTWDTPASSSVTNLTVDGSVNLTGGIAGSTLTVGQAAAGAFIHNAGEINIGTANLQIGNANATNFSRTSATATYSGTGYMIWNSTGAFNHSTVVAAGAMTINKFRTLLNLALVNGRGLTVVQNLDILNSSVFTNNVAGVGYLTVGDATNVPVITLGENAAGDPNIATNAVAFGNANVDYIFTDAAGAGNGFTVTTTAWPTAQAARNVTVNMANNATTVLLTANRTITTALNLTEGVLGWDTPTVLTLNTDVLVTRDQNSSLNNDAVAGGGGTGTLTAPSVDLKYTNAVGNTGIEYSLPTVVRNFTLGLPAGTTVSVASSRTIAGTMTWNSVLTFNGATTTNVTMAQTLPALSGVTVNGAGIVNWNGGFINNGTYTNNGTTVIPAGMTFTGSGTYAGAGTLTLNGNGTVNNSTFAAGATINANADLTFTGTITTGNNLTTVFGGAAAQAFTVPGNVTLGPVTLAKTSDAIVTLSGGNLTLAAGSNLTLTRGVLLVSGTNSLLTLNLTTIAGTPNIVNGFGFVRNPVSVSHLAHIVGRVGVAVGVNTIGRIEWPVGSNTKYRPAAITFTAGNATIAPTTIIVGHVDMDPTGTKNFPVDGGVKFTDNTKKLWIAGRAPYYWTFEATTSLGASQKFDVELNGTNLNKPLENHNDLRIIRRFDGDVTVNGWFLEGAGSSYSNAMYVNSPNVGDTLLVVRNMASVGSAISQKALFTLGLPSLKPTFTATAPAAVTIAENTTYNFTFAANDQDVTASAITYSLQGTVPANATINATSGVFTFSPNFTQGSTTPYTFVVRAAKTLDATSYSEYTFNVTVTNVNRVPVFTTAGQVATASGKYGAAYNFTYAATDADGEAITYAITSVVPAPATMPTISNAIGLVGLFNWTPVFADKANSPFVITVTATDASGGVATTTTTFTVLAGYDRGDANTNSVVDVNDAIRILEYVVGKSTLSAEQMLYADANTATGDGMVGALDASYVLKYIANGNSWTGVSKVVATAGAVEFSRMSSENGVLSLPFAISGTKGVTSVYAEADLNNPNIEVGKINLRLPEGWLSATSVENGKIKIAAAGINAINDGIFATVEVTLKDKEAAVSIVGNAKLNDEISSSLTAKVREIPSEFALSQNYPNPFNPTTSIKFSVAQDAKVNLVVYDMLGQRVRTLVDGIQEAGFYTVRWDGSNDFGSKVSSGIYIYRLQAGNFVSTMKMNLMK